MYFVGGIGVKCGDPIDSGLSHFARGVAAWVDFLKMHSGDGLGGRSIHRKNLRNVHKT